MDEAKLVYSVVVGGIIAEIETPVYVEVADIYGKEFYLSYQSGISVSIAFMVNKYDFEETKHLDPDTSRPLYATKVKYENAVYDIVRHQTIKDSDNILIVCS